MGESNSITLLALDIDGVLTDGRVMYTPDGQEQKSISFRDIDAVFEARRRGFQVALITSEDTPWVEFIGRRLQIEQVVRGAKDKLEAIRRLAEQLGVPLNAICYLGDSDRDAPALEAVGLGMAPADATTKAKAFAHKVLTSPGGDGAVQEAVSSLLKQKNPAQIPLKKDRNSQDDLDSLDPYALAQKLQQIVADTIAFHQVVAVQLKHEIVQATHMISTSLKEGKKILVFGGEKNEKEARYFAAQIMGRINNEARMLVVISLTSDTFIPPSGRNHSARNSTVARQIYALGEPGDIAIAISTNGESSDTIQAIATAAEKHMKTIALISEGRGGLADNVDLCLSIPTIQASRIEEAYLLITNSICALLESTLQS